MARNELYLIDTQDDEEMGLLAGDLPLNLILWRVNFDEEDDEFRLHYDQVAQHTLPSATEEALKEYLVKVLDEEEPTWSDDIQGQDSGPTPMSISHLDRSIMVFVLRKRKKWEFSAEKLPFTVRRGGKQYYMMARAVERSAHGVELVERPGEGCRVALFVADAAADYRDNAVNGEFRTEFNIFVDLLLRRSGGPPPRRMPIAIDPDVGHPGGSAPLP